MSTFEEFRRRILKLDLPREHKIKNSYGVYDAFKFYRKNKEPHKKYVLTESQYFAIIRLMNLKIADEILKGKEVRFPRRMGALEIRKKPTKVEYIDGEIVDNLKVDWDTTLKLWYEDKESYDNKTIIKLETDETFLVYYHKRRAVFNNRSYYAFSTNNLLKQKLKTLIQDNKIDAFELWHDKHKVLK